jgi:hypothetical protein
MLKFNMALSGFISTGLKTIPFLGTLGFLVACLGLVLNFGQNKIAEKNRDLEQIDQILKDQQNSNSLPTTTSDLGKSLQAREIDRLFSKYESYIEPEKYLMAGSLLSSGYNTEYLYKWYNIALNKILAEQVQDEYMLSVAYWYSGGGACYLNKINECEEKIKKAMALSKKLPPWKGRRLEFQIRFSQAYFYRSSKKKEICSNILSELLIEISRDGSWLDAEYLNRELKSLNGCVIPATQATPPGVAVTGVTTPK